MRPAIQKIKNIVFLVAELDRIGRGNTKKAEVAREVRYKTMVLGYNRLDPASMAFIRDNCFKERNENV